MPLRRVVFIFKNGSLIHYHAFNNAIRSIINGQGAVTSLAEADSGRISYIPTKFRGKNSCHCGGGKSRIP